ncbi:hypothetical protein O181_050682 [Austropuccinia psidii MF-1]|uniref:Uncharacterized protein n=1 Tax=Austropuccinia psidii MF-1 TaxID=1389203 RepID=A0A9Q3DZF7_9BASI|nr:hypothetical protein [Austropuccinia psidii MF-1]
MCETLFNFILLQYEPGTSLENHINSLQRTFASYESLTQSYEDTMSVLLDRQNQGDKSDPPNHTENHGKGNPPTRGQNKNRSNRNQKKEENSLVQLEKLERIGSKFELTSKTPNINVVFEHSKEPSGDSEQSDSDAYFVED